MVRRIPIAIFAASAALFDANTLFYVAIHYIFRFSCGINFNKNNVPGCDGTTSMNGGTCINTGIGKGYLCLCTSGYTGVLCETGNSYQFLTEKINQSYWYQYLALFVSISVTTAVVWVSSPVLTKFVFLRNSQAD